MTVALVAMSHSPLLDYVEPPADIKKAVYDSFEAVSKFAKDFDPDLVINIGPDHYNGFFYDIMPPFAVGYAASAVGDFGTHEGPLNVPSDDADSLIRSLMDQDLDVTVSWTMEVDHGAVQPMELMFGEATAKPVIPVFINAVATPFVPIRRIRKLGEAIGNWAKAQNKKVLIIGSGGLSHEPPVPQLATADEATRAALLGGGRHLSPEARKARTDRVVNAAKDFAAGVGNVKPLAPEWDQELMEILASGDLSPLDKWTPEEMAQIAGNSSHEVRTWIAAYAALGQCGKYEVVYSFYKAIPEYIAGFGVTAARLA